MLGTAPPYFREILGLFHDFVAAVIKDGCPSAWQTRRPFVNAESALSTAPSINGHMIVPRPGHSIAIYERNGENYVAEFRGPHGEFGCADTWFRFRSGVLRYSPYGRASLDSAAPLTPAMVQKIERLHAASDARQARMLAVPRRVAAAARRYWTNAISGLRGRAARISQTLG